MKTVYLTVTVNLSLPRWSEKVHKRVNSKKYDKTHKNRKVYHITEWYTLAKSLETSAKSLCPQRSECGELFSCCTHTVNKTTKMSLYWILFIFAIMLKHATLMSSFHWLFWSFCMFLWNSCLPEYISCSLAVKQLLFYLKVFVFFFKSWFIHTPLLNRWKRRISAGATCAPSFKTCRIPLCSAFVACMCCCLSLSNEYGTESSTQSHKATKVSMVTVKPHPSPIIINEALIHPTHTQFLPFTYLHDCNRGVCLYLSFPPTIIKRWGLGARYKCRKSEIMYTV